ncbi:Antiseptic resistance protein (plasmid) [Streptomyces sp. enrichment culture]|uniref:MFS transporter n=1 Tax=Streptomyces sp. enrichment culture TaxID=1795815 RepID=UPI003F578F24
MTTGGVTKAGRREWLGLAVLALPTFLVSFDIFVLLLALPQLSADLGADGNEQLWIMDIYGFTLAGFLLTMGTLGDRIGRRKLLLIGATVFGIASVTAAFATSPGLLIAARAVLGIAGATLAPSTLALISTMFRDDKQRASAIGIWGGMFTLGAIIGPVLGGVMLEAFWWGSVFLLGVPAMVLLLAVGPAVLPEFRDTKAGRADALSVVLSLAGILPLIYGIKELARTGWEPLPLASLVAGLVFGTLFLRRQRRLSDPLVDLKLFSNGAFSVTLGSLLTYSLVGGATMLFASQFFQLVGGLSTLRSGLAMLPGMAAATVAFAITPAIAAKVRPAYLISGGMVGTAICMVVFTQATSVTTLVVGFAVFSFCGAPLVALGTNLVIANAPMEKAGSAGSLAQMCNEFGSALGIAVVGTVGSAVYRHQIHDAIPAGVPAAITEAARDSLAGAGAAVAGAPERLRTAVLSPAQEAFTASLHAVTGIGAVLLAGVAVLIAAKLRHVPPVGQEEPGPAKAPVAQEPSDAPVPETARV